VDRYTTLIHRRRGRDLQLERRRTNSRATKKVSKLGKESRRKRLMNPKEERQDEGGVAKVLF